MQTEGSKARQHLFDVFDAAKVTGQQVRDMRSKFEEGKVLGTMWWRPDVGMACFWGWFTHIVYGAQTTNDVHAALYDKVLNIIPKPSPWSLDPGTMQGFIMMLGVVDGPNGTPVLTNEVTPRHIQIIGWMNEYMDAHYWRREGLSVNDFRTLLSEYYIPASEIQEDIDYCMEQDDPQGYLHSLAGYRTNMRTDEIATWLKLHNEALVQNG